MIGFRSVARSIAGFFRPKSSFDTSIVYAYNPADIAFLSAVAVVRSEGCGRRDDQLFIAMQMQKYCRWDVTMPQVRCLTESALQRGYITCDYAVKPTHSENYGLHAYGIDLTVRGDQMVETFYHMKTARSLVNWGKRRAKRPQDSRANRPFLVTPRH